ncbi:MAG: hypothetical protein ACO1SX_10120 [Actinomycetota bacterium]
MVEVEKRMMGRLSRRELLTAAAGLVSAPALAATETTGRKKRLAIVTTVWRPMSHAHHMGDRFLVGYPLHGKWRKPAVEVVSAYVDQFPANDLARSREKEFGFRLYPTIAEALRCGGNRLAVDAVLIIGEHGDYPNNELGQKLYPRYEFFIQAADVFRKEGRGVPVFNDKHLSWNWEWARKMVDTSKELGFPFLAGSSLPSTWRMPAIDLPYGAEVEEALVIGAGGIDVYDFHLLEALQSILERRRGGETGVKAVHAMRGDRVWKAMASGSWAGGGWDPALFEACLTRTQTLRQATGFSHRHPTTDEIREWVRDPIAYRIEYADGLKATMLLLNGLVGDISVAARLRGRKEPLSTLFYLPSNPNVSYSAPLMAKAEEMFVTGRAPFPIERTLLTTGLVAAGVKSLGTGEKRLDTPHLSVRYRSPRKSLFVNE